MDNVTIYRKRGDTYRIRITFTTSDGSALDLTDATLTMTVNRLSEPDDMTSQVFQIDGSIVAPATGGICDFMMDSTKANNVGSFHYDIEMEDVNGKRRTILEGPFIMGQDITKSDASGVIEFSGETPTDPIVVDGSGLFLPYYYASESDVFTYETEGARTVIRVTYGASDKYTRYLDLAGSSSETKVLPLPIRVKMLVYVDLANTSDYVAAVIREQTPGGYNRYVLAELAQNAIWLSPRLYADGTYPWGNYIQEARTHAAGWWWVGVELYPDGTTSADIWADGDTEPDPWTVTTDFSGETLDWTWGWFIRWEIYSSVAPQASVFELARIEWELL